MTIELSDTILTKAKASEQTVKLLIAIALFEAEIMTLGQAALFAGLPQLLFQRELAKRKIPQHYDMDELRSDLNHLQSLL